MGANLQVVDITTLGQGAIIYLGLNNGKTMCLVVTDPTAGQVTIYVDTLRPIAAEITNDAGQHVLSVGDDLKLGDEPLPLTVSSLRVDEGMTVVEFRIEGMSAADIADLAADLTAIEGMTVIARHVERLPE